MSESDEESLEIDDPSVRNSIVALIRVIEKRPALYIGQRYISSLAAFIDGWYCAHESPIPDAHVFRDFEKWLRAKYDVTSNRSWDQIILFYSSDQYDALGNFFTLWNMFLQEASENPG